METCGIVDYSINDLTAPTAKRLRKQLSGVINFAKFREERLQLLAELTLQRDVLTDQRSKQSKKGYSISYNQSYGYMYNEYMACHIR